MAVPAAVALVRQVQCVVENPDVLRANKCLDQVCSFLDCFLDHPDSRARLGAARALAQLSARLSSDEWQVLEFRHASRVLSRLRSKRESGNTDQEDDEMLALLEVVLGGDVARGLHGGVAPVAATGARVGEVVSGKYGEVLRLRACIAMDEQVRSAARQALVLVGGVVSVTFETYHIVIGARTPELANDPGFIEDVCVAVEEQLILLRGFERGNVLVVPELEHKAAALLFDKESIGSDEDPEFLDDDEEDDAERDVATADCKDDLGRTGETQTLADVEEDFDNEVAYLDDSEEEDGAAGSQTGGPLSAQLGSTWSFFSQAGFFGASQRVQEYEEDPRLTARLHRAHLRLERRRHEEQMRLRRVLSVITPLRAGAGGFARSYGKAYEIPGVEDVPGVE